MKKRCIISQLEEVPVELIQRIQSLLHLKEAARTCILSKSWLHAWSTIPMVRFFLPEPRTLYSTDENVTKYKNLIHNTLQRYHRDNIPIESFDLSLSIIKNNQEDLASHVKTWIQQVVSKTSLKELSLYISIDDSLTLPNELFSCPNLNTIHVACPSDNFVDLRLRICTNPVIKCMSLRMVVLYRVIITEDVFHNLLSTCILLEKIKLSFCQGLKNVKVKNLLHLRELNILVLKDDALWEINNVPSLHSLSYHLKLGGSWKPIPFQMDTLASVTQLHMKGVMIDNSFLDIVNSKFPLLESLAFNIGRGGLEKLVITSDSLKWLTLRVSKHEPVNIEVHAPKLLSFIYGGINMIPGLMFPIIAPEKIELTLSWRKPIDHSFFLKMREVLNLSHMFDITIYNRIFDSITPLDIEYLRKRVSSPVTNVQLSLATLLDDHAWEHSRFFDAFFSICHPNYIKSSEQVIRKMMEGNTTDLKDVQLKNPHNGKWEALTSSWKSVLDTLTGQCDLECKLHWFS